MLRSALRFPLLLLIFAVASALVSPLDADARGRKKKKDKKVAAEKAEEKDEKWDVSAPPGDWQTISIDTDETTWSDVDVSPDGSTLVFDMLGDIFTVPIEGGEATALSVGIDWSFQPRFSPDGQRIAFISDREGGDNLWVMNADGTEPKSLTSESDNLVHNPWWSPDGQWILTKKGFTSSRSIPAGEIWMIHSGGGSGLQITERPNGKKDQKTMAEPSFSPDGRYIYYSQDTSPGATWQYNKDSTGEIFVIKRLDRETGETDVFCSGAGGAIRPTPSPDGRHLAFVKRMPGLLSALYLKDLESGNEKLLYEPLERDLQETNGSQGNTTAFSWTPDSRSIVFWSGGHFHRVDRQTGEASRIPVRVKVDKKISKALRFPVEVSPEQFGAKMIRWAQRSPDGQSVLFQALGQLWTRPVSGGEPRRLTGQSDRFEQHPRISPDGDQVAYTTWDDDDLGRLRVVPISGGAGRDVVSTPGHYVEPAFSPDGKWLVYRKISGGWLLSPKWSKDPGLYVVPVAGGEPTRVSRTGWRPSFSADGERILYSDSGEDNGLVLRSVNLDGYDEKTHLQGAEVTEVSVSPDGKWMAFTEQFDAYVAPFALTGRSISISKEMKSIPAKKVSSRSGSNLHWSASSDELRWSHGPTLFSRRLADAFAFLEGAPEELPEPVAAGLDLGFLVDTDRPEGVTALIGARVVTMRNARATEEVIEDGVVLVEANRIVAVGSRSEVEIPESAFVVDAAGTTIIPGLVDVHAHGAMARDGIVPEQNWQQLSNLSFGVTTVHDPSNTTSEIFAAAEMQRAGRIVAPRIYSTGTILYGAHAPGYSAKIESRDDALFHVRRLRDAGAISVKSYQQSRRDQRQKVIDAARELGIMVYPEGGAKFQHNMGQIVDGHTGIEHAIPLARLYSDVVQLWSQTEVGYTPTFGVAYGGLSGETYWYDRTEVWKNERLMAFAPKKVIDQASMRRTAAPDNHYNHFEVARTAKMLSEAGVSVQIGAHGQREGLAAHWEMWMMNQGGFTPWEAIRGATIDGAWYCGLDADLGSLEVGKLADLVVIDGDPLSDLRQSERIVYTMINGRLFEAATMNEVGHRPRPRGELYFEKEGGDSIHPATAEWLSRKQEMLGWVH